MGEEETATVPKSEYDMLCAQSELLDKILGNHDLLEGYMESCPEVCKAAGFEDDDESDAEG